jgi:surface carbohydrate biosynthesis protein
MNMFYKSFPKIKFSNPAQNNIIILHQPDLWIKKIILNELKSTTIEVYPKTFYITRILFVKTFSNLKLIDLREIAKKRSFKFLLEKIYQIYIIACLDVASAKVVLTLKDNSIFFQNLSRLDSNRVYFAIQNGTRTISCVRDSLPSFPDPKAIISMTNFFCFGKRDVDLFQRNGHLIDNYYPVGSLIGSHYKNEVSFSNKINYDLCLVSQWNASFFEQANGNTYADQEEKRTATGIIELNNLLTRFIKETGFSLIIAMRHDDNERESLFFKEKFGESLVNIGDSDSKNYSTYRLVDQSSLVIALNSTVLLEAFSWGKKVLWCNMMNDSHFEMPDAGISYFNGSDYSSFKERILMLLSISQNEYESKTIEGARYINNYISDHPAGAIIRTKIIDSLSKIK